MKLQTTLFLLIYFFPSVLFGQHTLTGKIIDTDSQNINGALVTIYEIDDSTTIVNNTVSDSSGNFSLTAPNGVFWFEINYWGAVLLSEKIEINDSYNFNNIMLDSSPTNELKDITVKGHKPIVKLKEGNIIFTPNKIKSANTTLDILKVTPMVVVQQNTIQIIGKGNAIIKVNGKQLFISNEALINYLNEIPASEVENIIVAKNTFAETDAENKNGFIDIKLKQKLINNGIDGSVYLSLSKATYFGQNIGGSLNYYNDKIRWSNRIGFYNGKYMQEGKNKIYYSDLLLEENEKNIFKTIQPTFSSEFEYQPNQFNTISLGASYRYLNQGSSINGQSDFHRNNSIDSSYFSNGENPFNQHNISINADYVHLYDSTGKSTSVSLVHYRSLFDRGNTVYNSATGSVQELRSIKTGNFQNMGITTFSIDNQLPNQFAQLSFGAKLTFISNKNQSDFYTLAGQYWNPEYAQFDNFNYYEYTQALYLKASKSIKKWNFVAGLRTEFTQTKGESIAYNQKVNRNFEMLFPSGNATYNHNQHNNYSFSYSRKVDRPGFYQVNPFKRFNNEYSYFSGNPFLQPYFSHNFDATYMRNNRWIYSLSYQKATNVYSEVEITDTSSIYRAGSIKNFSDFNNATFSLSTNYNILGKWLLYPSASISYYNFISKDAIVSSSNAITSYLSIYNQITLDSKEKYFLSISGFYAFANNSGVMQFRSRWNSNIGITYRTWQNKLRINLSANDLFRSNVLNYNSTVNNILRERHRYNDSRNISLSVSYNFTKGKTKKFNPKSQNNNEEIKRIK